MRAMFMVVASIFLAVGLFGCNRQQQVAVQTPVTVTPPPAAVPPPPPPPPAPVVEAAHRVRYHRHHYAVTRSYDSYSESESASYTQSGDSENDYDGGGDEARESYEHSAAAQAHGEVWVDGYGREHYAVATPDDNPGALSAEDEHLRRKPWRGWNSDCDRR
ncbi:MAG: hypothetical protein JOZ72_05270 [Alphaproteobacteria bacterium]|nr:hypothetical protein [Alphaproteobacteria bacterium]